jgi:hypothetical protein
LAARRLNSHRNGYRMLCKPPWTSTATAWSPVRHAGPSTRIRPARAYPETALRERSQDFLGRSLTGCRILLQLTNHSEGMPWARMVLSWMTHQMPRRGDRCPSVRRKPPSASSGGLGLSQTPTHPHIATPARRGRCLADLGAKRCEPALPSGLVAAALNRRQRSWLSHSFLEDRAEDRTWRPEATRRLDTGQCGDGG